ncbi:MAG: 1-acyl-sn-glycerol-3-phosphate acyltransferase [Ruminococcaceae bacterium]|nr:1-acyl-sn-glycerol-3-phosphate acyltransferase [Oscillospiraceae bacterium]
MKKNSKGSVFYRICYFLFAKIVGFLFRIKVVNPEAEPDEGGFLVCANHVSAADAVVICYAFRKHQVRLMAKKELFKIPGLSALIKMLGAFPVDRGGNDVGAIKHAVEMLKEGMCVGIFPQGTRHPAVDPRGTPVKNGAALIATRAGSDFLPIYLHRKNNKHKIFRRTYVIIGERMSLEEMSYQPDNAGEYKRLTEAVFDKVCALGEEFTKTLGKGKKNEC